MSGWLRRVAFRNFSLKVIALALAVLLHVLVRPVDHGRSSARNAGAVRVRQTQQVHAPDAGAMPQPGALSRQGRRSNKRHASSQPATRPAATTRPTSPPGP